jgi:PAS domain S-box-containing protein
MNSRILTRIGPWPAITLLAGLALTGVLTQQRATGNEEVASRRFNTLATRIQHDIVVQFERYEYGLNSARGVVLTGGEQGLTRSMFEAYAVTRHIEREFPGARGFGFIRRVPLSQERRFLKQARADGAPRFAIRQLAPNALERFVIQYIEPKADNQQAIGLDIGSERNRREAAVTAMRTGEATLTGPITLVQATGATLRSFLVVLPVYRPQSVLATPEQRWAGGFGWTYAPLVIDEVLRNVDLQRKSVALTLTDTTQPDRPEVFYAPDAAGTGTGSAPSTDLATTLNHRLFGRSWALGLQAKPAFYDELNLTSPLSVASWGSLLTGLIALLHCLLAMVARRRESAQAQARLATIVANASDAIIGEGVDGRIMLWNAAAEKLFGRSLADVEGQALAKLLLPPDRSDEDQALIARIVAGESISPFETTRLHRAGHLIPVAMTACAIADGQGRVIGVAKLLRDISERKGHEARLLNLNAELESRVAARTREVTSTKEMLKTVLNAVPMMISYWDKSKILRVANRAYCDFLGRPEAELIGRPGDEVTKPGVWAAVEPFVDAVLRGQEQRFEFTAMPSGGTRRLELQAQLLPQIDRGETTGFYAISQDLTERITQRKLLEATLSEQQIERETLRESQAFLERVSRVAGVGGWMYDLQSQHFTWSGQTCRLMDATDVMGSSAQWLVGAQVLLVDDSEINLEIARRLLERQGAQVQTCTDGLQALHKLEEANHGIELVLMDVQMPVMDGLDATRAIRANPAIARLPIIAVTAGALKEEKRRVLASGMNDFLAKPLDPNALVRMVRQHIERHRGTPLPIAATRPVPGALASWPQIEGIHIESAAGQLGGDLELFIRMLGWLLNDYRDLPAELAPAGLGARLQDPLQRQHLSARVHKLRGTAGTLGAHALKDAATATEAALQKPGADASAAARSLLGALQQLTAACQPVIEALAPQNAAAPPISPLSQAALDELRGLLGAQDFAALDRFYCLESALNAGLPASDFAALQTAVSQLDFASALTHLPTRITP